MAKKTMRIAFPFGGILPAEITGGKEKTVPPHEPVSVPVAYGRQLTDDRFAYDAEKMKPAAQKKVEAPLPEFTDLEKSVEDARTALEAAQDLESQGKAQAALDEAERALADARKSGASGAASAE